MQCWLMKYEVIIQRRQYEIERISRMYDENQDIRKRLAFAEAANVLLKDKQHKLIKSKQENECYISQHDLEQIKSYSIQIKNSSFEKQDNKNKSITNFEIINEPKFMISNILKTYSCPLIQPNVFGITLEHNIRFDCDGSTYNKSHLTRHLEYYHQMLPECALRLRNAIVNGQSSSDQIKLFSDNEIILNKEFFSDCPLTNATNIFGAQSSLSILMHIPCTKKQMALASMINHFQYYHKLKYNAAKKIFNAMKNKSLTSDIILFETNEHIGNPQEADPLMRLQKDLDDTKDILKKTLVNVLERGEHLDDLVDRSNHLSIETKAIYKTARKTNRCCTLF
ncbi:unnamed protein product [Rotaria sp. Silwood1]|nr:unnamed protein product [Rotaria sp. Silwood1]